MGRDISKNVFMPSFSILWKGTFVETRALTRSEDVVRAGVHGVRVRSC